MKVQDGTMVYRIENSTRMLKKKVFGNGLEGVDNVFVEKAKIA